MPYSLSVAFCRHPDPSNPLKSHPKYPLRASQTVEVQRSILGRVRVWTWNHCTFWPKNRPLAGYPINTGGYPIQLYIIICNGYNRIRVPPNGRTMNEWYSVNRIQPLNEIQSINMIHSLNTILGLHPRKPVILLRKSSIHRTGGILSYNYT